MTVRLLLAIFLLVPSAALAAWNDAAVQVRAETSANSNNVGSGVIFASNDDESWVLSCAHVVSGGRRYWVGVPNHGECYPANLVAAQKGEGIDLALLKLSRGDLPFAPLAPAAPHAPIKAKQAGYPHATLVQRRRFGRMVGYSFTSKCTTLDFGCQQGDSGSPMYDEHGRVIGILWGGIHGKSYGTNLTTIKRWLGRRCPPGAICAPPAPTTGDRPTLRPIPPAPRPDPQLPPAPGPDDNGSDDAEWQRIMDDIAKMDKRIQENHRLVLKSLNSAGQKGERGPKGPAGPEGKAGPAGRDADDQAILLALYNKIKSDPQFRGPEGPPGKGFDPADYDDLLQRVQSLEERTITLEVYRSGELIGSSTGKHTVRFDFQPLE